MPASMFSDDELLAFLDELLSVERAALLERELRESEPLRLRLAALMQRRESGGTRIGDVWRENRLSCPNRETLGSYLLEALEGPLEDYVRFHLQTIGCRVCRAIADELMTSRATESATTPVRVRRYFESSAGLLRRDHSNNPESRPEDTGRQPAESAE